MSISSTRVTTFCDYAYSVSVSATNNPTLKNQDGTDYTKGEVALVQLHINGTGTPDTDQFYIIGYNGSGTNEIRAVDTRSPAVSNRPELYLDSNGIPSLRTGHQNNYTVRVHVIKSIG